MKFNEYFFEAEGKELPEYDEEQFEIGMKDEKEHDDIWDKLEDFSKEKDVELPFTHKEFTEMIVKAHLNKDPEYYTKEEKMEEEPVEENSYGNNPSTQLTVSAKD